MLVQVGVHIEKSPMFLIDWDFCMAELQYAVGSHTAALAPVVVALHKIVICCQNLSNPRMPGIVTSHPVCLGKANSMYVGCRTAPAKACLHTVSGLRWLTMTAEGRSAPETPLSQEPQGASARCCRRKDQLTRSSLGAHLECDKIWLTLEFSFTWESGFFFVKQMKHVWGVN